LSAFIVRARTPVERDGYDREVVVMPSSEAPSRLVGALSALLAGIEAIGANTTTVWRIVTKAGWDCLPELRRQLLGELRRRPAQRTADLVATTGIPTSTANRALEDMTLLGIVERSKQGSSDNSPWVHGLSFDADREWPDE
jgi:hypothetical protein